MQNYFRIAEDALSTLEQYIPDMVEAVEKDAEETKIRAMLNRMANLVNEVRAALN